MRKEADTNKQTAGVTDQPSIGFSFKRALLSNRSQTNFAEISRSEVSILPDESRIKKNILKYEGQAARDTSNGAKKVTFSKEVTKNEARMPGYDFRQNNLKSSSVSNLSHSASEFVQHITHKIDIEKLLKICQSSSFDYLSPSSSSSSSSSSQKQHDEVGNEHDSSSSNRNNSFSSESLDDDNNTSKSTLNGGGCSPCHDDEYYDEVNHGYDNNDAPFPFPLPPSCSELIFRTDLNLSDSLNNSSSSSNASHCHGYMTSTSEEMMDGSSQKCFELLNELISKNEEQLLALKILKDDYFASMLKYQESSTQTIAAMDSIVTRMCDFQENVILRELEAKRTNWSKVAFTFCDVIARHMRNIKLYETYAAEFETHLKSLNSLFDNERVCTLLNILDRKIETKYFNLKLRLNFDYGMPCNFSYLKLCSAYCMQWACSINTFLIAYENFIPIDSDESKCFNEIIEYFNELASKSIDSIENAKRLEILFNIQKRIGTKYTILDKRRVLIREGILVTQSPYLGSIIRIYVILLNDLLVICDIVNNDLDNLKPKRPLNVTGLTVSDDVNYFSTDHGKVKIPNVTVTTAAAIGSQTSTDKESQINPDFGFVINVPCIQKIFKFYTRSSQEKFKWCNLFQTVAQAHKFQPSGETVKAPSKFFVGKADMSCFKCKSEFTSLNRKYHCKACGYLFCRHCSKAQASLDYDSGKRNRVCDFCYDYMFKTGRSRPPTLEQVNQRMRHF